MLTKTMVGLLTAGTLVACGSGTTEVTVGLYADFGYADLIAEYERAHPDIDVVVRTADPDEHHRALAAGLAEGTAADIEAIALDRVHEFTRSPGDFVDVTTTGMANRWLGWVWSASLSADGRQIGYGAHIGGLAVCYRPDLLSAAGLPVDRDDLAARWPTWEAYLDLGKRFQASAPAGVSWVDSLPAVLDAMADQSPDDLKQAWDLAMTAVDLTGGTESATTLCSAGQMPDGGGWDMTTVPGAGGNRGGAYLTVPAEGSNVEEATALAAWLTAPEQQARVFAATGLLPSTPSVYGEQSVAGRPDPAVNDAPVGRLLSQAATALGPHPTHAQAALDRAAQRVAAGELSSAQAWNQVSAEIEGLAK
ncbi:extracellular solute-binding protein [Actinokineospora sp. NPDC004072]